MLSDRVIINASPLITLFKSGQADLLPRLFHSVLIPDAVWREVAAAGHEDIATRSLSVTPWLTRLPIQPPDPLVLAWDGRTG